MSKKYSTSAPTLIIVESPAKCKKIEEYLGPGYKCVASFGHLRELKNLENINIDNGFTVKYTKIETKEKHISLLKKEVNILIQHGFTNSDDIKKKIKKTYKNRHFLINK